MRGHGGSRRSWWMPVSPTLGPRRSASSPTWRRTAVNTLRPFDDTVHGIATIATPGTAVHERYSTPRRSWVLSWPRMVQRSGFPA